MNPNEKVPTEKFYVNCYFDEEFNDAWEEPYAKLTFNGWW